MATKKININTVNQFIAMMGICIGFPPEEHGKVGSFASSDLRGKPTNAEFIRLQYCVMIELSVQDIKTYRGTLGKYTPGQI
jgi:hypothetical protein